MKLRLVIFGLLLIVGIGIPLTIKAQTEADYSNTKGDPQLLAESAVMMLVGDLPSVQCTNEPSKEWYVQGGCAANSAEKSAMNSLGKAMAGLISTPPASGEVYIAQAIRKVNPATPAYAQGYGFSVLQPVLGMWSAALNVSYALFTIAFLVVGFAIMFRAKLNAQVVVNIQMALPRMVITLVLISMSYAIVGLMIDLMYISTFLIVEIFRTYIFESGTVLHRDAKQWAFQNIFGSLMGLIIGTPGEVESLAYRAALAIGTTVSDLITGPDGLSEIIGFFTGIIFILIFAVVLFVSAFKIFFALLNSYIQILIQIISAPLQLLLNIYPGSNAFMKWFRNIAANLAVFPVTVVMLFLVFAMMGIQTKDGIGFGVENILATDISSSAGFTAPLIGVNSRSFQGLVGIGVILMIPKVIELTKGAFGVQDKGQGGFMGMGVSLPGTGLAKAALKMPGSIIGGVATDQFGKRYEKFRQRSRDESQRRAGEKEERKREAAAMANPLPYDNIASTPESPTSAASTQTSTITNQGSSAARSTERGFNRKPIRIYRDKFGSNNTPTPSQKTSVDDPTRTISPSRQQTKPPQPPGALDNPTDD